MLADDDISPQSRDFLRRGKAFADKFRFFPSFRGWLGIELELFVRSRASGLIVPEADRIIRSFNEPWCKPELGRTQVEITTDPCASALEVVEQLMHRLGIVRRFAARKGLDLIALEVAPEDLPVEAYPEPRYQGIARQMEPWKLLAAMRLAGLHVHHGCSTLVEAVRVHGEFVAHQPELQSLGDASQGLRQSLFATFFPNVQPFAFRDSAQFVRWQIANGFEHDPRLCWTWERISTHGTVEGRSCGALDDPDHILHLVRRRVEISGLPTHF